MSTPQSHPYHSYFRCLLRASPCHRRRGTVPLRLRRGGTPAALTQNRARRKRRVLEGGPDRELPGPRVGVRSVRLLENKAGHAVKAKPDFR